MVVPLEKFCTYIDPKELRKELHMSAPRRRKPSVPMTYRDLMFHSESYVERALEDGDEHERAITGRLTEQGHRYRDWEQRHSKLMKKVADANTMSTEIYRLRETAVSLLHISAVPRYLKAREIVGEDREVLMQAFHPSRDFTEAILVEHANFIRAETSSMCSHYLTARLGDLGLDNWFENYRFVLDDYFGMFCDRIVTEAKGERYLMKPLIQEAKADLVGQRVKILNSKLRYRQYDSLSPTVRQLAGKNS